MQFDAVETWQSHPLELNYYYAKKAAAETAFMNMNFRFICTLPALGQIMH